MGVLRQPTVVRADRARHIPARLRRASAREAGELRRGRSAPRHRRDAAPRVRARASPDVGWGHAGTIGELAGSGALLIAFTVNELRHRNALFPLSILRVPGLAAADATQIIALAGFYSLFFFVTLYMQNVLHYSQIQAGAAYLPTTFGVALSAGIGSQLALRVGTRPVIVVGALIAAGGVYWLSRIPVHGSYVSDLLPGLVIMSLGLGAVFVGVTTAAQAGVPADRAGLAAALINASTWLGGALGLAVLSAVSTSRAHDLLVAHLPVSHALTSGFQRALLVCSVFIAAAALIALRATNTRSQSAPAGALATQE